MANINLFAFAKFSATDGVVENTQAREAEGSGEIIGISIDGNEECPLKYMEDEFLAAFKEMFAVADYQYHSDAPCACNCEVLTPNY